MIPLRLGIDTNIVISAALRPDGLQRTTLLLAITKRRAFMFLNAILAEYREVLAEPTPNRERIASTAASGDHKPCAPDQANGRSSGCLRSRRQHLPRMRRC